jgi:hypothetical protein
MKQSLNLKYKEVKRLIICSRGATIGENLKNKSVATLNEYARLNETTIDEIFKKYDERIGQKRH